MFVMQLHASRGVIVTSATWFCLVNLLTPDATVTSGLLSDVIIHMHLCNLKITQIQSQGESWKDRGLGKWGIGRGGPKSRREAKNTRVGRRKKKRMGTGKRQCRGVKQGSGGGYSPAEAPRAHRGFDHGGYPGGSGNLPFVSETVQPHRGGQAR